MCEQKQKTLVFAPSGTVNLLTLHQLAELVGAFASVQAEVLPPFKPPEESFNPVRRQYHAGMLLKYLAALHPGCLRVVGITSHDLYLPIFTHVYGEAQMDGHAAIISLFRLAVDDNGRAVDHDTFLGRAAKVVLHELFHTFGLVHCRHSACLMRPVIRIADLDDLSLQLCRSCGRLWEQILKD